MKTNWNSSYEDNNYGEFFYSLIRIFQPDKVVELGTKNGYSAYYIAKALTDNGHGTLDCYDLWEKYIDSYGIKSVPQNVATENLKEFSPIITLNRRDALGVEKNYETVDILHVDLDNDADILEDVVPAWLDKTRQLIILEGGSFERDKIGKNESYKKLTVDKWLTDLNNNQADVLEKIIPKKTGAGEQFVIVEGDSKYNKKPISKWLKQLKIKYPDIDYIVLEPYPSVTVIKKNANL